jgi:uncharacterized membrane protein
MSERSNREMAHKISKERISALSDAVIAIAATILVLGLKVPENVEISSQLAWHWSRIMLGWAVSFVVIATVWFDTHALFRNAREWSSTLAILTFLQLGTVSLVPFVSNLVIDHPDSLAAAISFSLVMLANGLISAFMGQVLVQAPELHAFGHTGRYLSHRVRSQIIMYGLTALMAILGAVAHHPFLGVALWVLSPILITLRQLTSVDQQAAEQDDA